MLKIKFDEEWIMLPTHKTVWDQYGFFSFPMGEMHINVDNFPHIPKVKWFFEGDRQEEIFQLCLLGSAILNKFHEKANLDIPYLPYARQDGVRSPGDPNSLQTLLIVLEPYFNISSIDIHNQDSASTIFNVTTGNVAVEIAKAHKYDYLVCPDEGAKKRFNNINYPSIFCSKKIDSKTGKLYGFEYNGPPIKGRLLIYDDICDGGGTFLRIRKLFPDNEMGLFVTHGGFTKGVEPLKAVFNQIFALNTLPSKRGVQYYGIE